jgi:hypothetical protein
MPITGPARANDNKQDSRLRKLSLNVDRFTNGVLTSHAIDSPRVSRRIEAIVRPVSAFDQAIMSVGALNLNDSDIVIDSYDSRDPNKSTGGLYDAAKRQENGALATDGNLINAGNAYVYGDVATNAGTVSGVANVSGVERTDFYQEPIPVAAPNWPSINPLPAVVSGTTNLLPTPWGPPVRATWQSHHRRPGSAQSHGQRRRHSHLHRDLCDRRYHLHWHSDRPAAGRRRRITAGNAASPATGWSHQQSAWRLTSGAITPPTPDI